MQKFLIGLLAVGTLILMPSSQKLLADDHHHHWVQQEQEVKAPKIFLDKNPRIVKYQLKRLDNTRLLLVPRKDDDRKYLLVHQEILLRDGMSQGDRDGALQAISRINASDPVAELLDLIPTLDSSQKDEQRIARQLVSLLLQQKPDSLANHEQQLIESTEAENQSLMQAGYSGLIIAGKLESAIELAKASDRKNASLLKALPLIGSQKIRNRMHGHAVATLQSKTSGNDVKNAAINAIASMDVDPGSDFQVIAQSIENASLMRAAVKALSKIPRKYRNPETADFLANFLVKFAEETPPKDRTSNSFIEAMQLADQVMGLIPKDRSDSFRKRLSDVTVRVVLLHAVEEEMRYDIPWFAVQAGTDLQIILNNEDLMAHNLVITSPGELQNVALEAAELGPKIGASGKQYVPNSDSVIAATEMIQAETQGRITFQVPTTPGEYPYVCTFPGHWMRMYGVMVVVEDLAAFEQNPVEPKDPVGSNRPFVKAWTVDDLAEKIESGLRGRSQQIGKKIFAEATCASCHQVSGEGKAVGPELTDVWSRWKGDGPGILREILEPSHKIEPKYIVRKVVTLEGEVVSGIVLAEDKDTISILPNPESPEPTVVNQDDIDDMVKSSVSIMPKALMDRFTEDEIFELLNYLKSVDPN